MIESARSRPRRGTTKPSSAGEGDAHRKPDQDAQDRLGEDDPVEEPVAGPDRLERAELPAPRQGRDVDRQGHDHERRR